MAFTNPWGFKKLIFYVLMLPLLVLFLELNANYHSYLIFLQKLEYISTRKSYTDLNKGGENYILTIEN